MGMTFNGRRNDDIKLVIGREKSPFSPLERTISNNGGNHRLRKTEKELLEISQPIAFTVNDNEDALEKKDRLSNWLVTDDWAELEFDDEPGRSYMAVVQNGIEDFEKIHLLRQGTIEFVAKETIGASHDHAIATTYTDVEVLGQGRTPWRSRTVFEADQDDGFELEMSNGCHIIIPYNFVDGDVLEIDYEKRKITLNGNDHMYISLQSHWMPLDPGYMQVRATHETELRYTERYY